MDVQEFQQAAAGESLPKPVYLLGPHKAPRAREATFEPLLAQEAVKTAVDRFVDPSMRDMCLNVYYADEANPREVVEVCQTFPFLAERRVVVVYRAELWQSDNAGGPLHRYLDEPADTALLILVANQIDKRQKLYKACEKAGEYVACGALAEHEALLWARNKLEERGFEVQGPAVRELIDRTGTSLGEAANAIELLVNYLGDRNTVRQEDVAAACADSHEEEVWALTDAIANSQVSEAVRVLRSIIEPNKNEFLILGSINWLLRSAYGVAAGGEAQKSVKPFVQKKVKPLADKLGRDKFRDAFALCTRTDLLMRSTGIDRSLALELLAIKLAAPRRRRPAGAQRRG
jgi:DNA polymerase-3 subunit delta